MIKICPLCKNPLQKWENKTHITFGCDDCAHDDMPKFMVSYTPDLQNIISYVWWLDNYYIQIDCQSENTTISKIIGYILIDSITIPSIIEVDFENPKKTATRLDTLMYFS